MKRQGRPQQQILKKIAKRRSAKARLESTIDPYQRRVFFLGAEHEGGRVAMGNGYVRKTSL